MKQGPHHFIHQLRRLDLDLMPFDLGAVELGDDAVGLFAHGLCPWPLDRGI
jgi:hypothetical protein